MDRPPYLIGHTLDLISHGLSISLTEISETAISDHFPIIIEFPVLASTASRSLLHALMIFFHLFILLFSQSWTLLDRQSEDLLAFINICISSGSVLAAFKCAVALLKKKN